MNLKKYLSLLLLGIILMLGFWFRYQGIEKQLSYWNDESHTALFARGILQYGSPVTEVGGGLGAYQIFLFYITAGSFTLLGVNEFAGRLPSVIAGTTLIIAIFLVVKKIVGEREAYIAAFLTAFSQIQLAWSTQLRPYIWLELCTLFVTYFCYKNLKNKKQVLDRNILFAAIISLIAGLFHGTGLINFALLIINLTYKSIVVKKYSQLLLVIPFMGVVFTIVFFSFLPGFQNILALLTRFDFNILHYIVFLAHNYWWLLVSAFIGALYLTKKDFNFFLILISFISTVFIVAIFKINSQYVRYSLPAFPLLYILYSIGVIGIIDFIRSLSKNKILNVVATIGIVGIFLGIPIAKQKILLAPQYYYSINADVRENPIVDYKRAFAKIEELIDRKQDVVVMDPLIDRVPWYLPGQRYVYLVKTNDKKVTATYGTTIAGTIEEFEKESIKYGRGVVIIENWESQAPPELQNHIKKTLKHEFDVHNLPYNEKDKWSISIYSWGL